MFELFLHIDFDQYFLLKFYKKKNKENEDLFLPSSAFESIECSIIHSLTTSRGIDVLDILWIFDVELSIVFAS
jgi:hypothetical protein